MTEHESHSIIVSRGRSVYLSLPEGMTASEWDRMLAWLAFTRPAIVGDEPNPVGSTSDCPNPSESKPSGVESRSGGQP